MINQLEELKNWQLAKEVNKEIYKIISRNSFNDDRPLRDQMNRSSASIMDNIAEGFGRNGSREFIQFLSCSKGSCVEIKSQLHRAMDRNHIDKREFESLYDKIDHIEKMNSNLISYLKKSDKRGWKFQDVSRPKSDV